MCYVGSWALDSRVGRKARHEPDLPPLGGTRSAMRRCRRGAGPPRPALLLLGLLLLCDGLAAAGLPPASAPPDKFARDEQPPEHWDGHITYDFSRQKTVSFRHLLEIYVLAYLLQVHSYL